MNSKRERLYALIKQDKTNIENLGKDKYRVGYCAQCGACCQNIDITVPMNDAVKDWLNMHEHLHAEIINGKGSLTMNVACKHLRWEGGVYSCAIYTDRPIFCKGYPRATPKHDTCKYIILDQMELVWFKNQIKKTT